MKNLALGIDIGGTNVRVGVVSSTGRLEFFSREPINQSYSGDDIVAFLTAQAHASDLLAKVGGGGIAVAATVSEEGIPTPEFTNFSVLGGYPIGDRLSQSLGIPFVVGNDANLALHGEMHFGAGRGCTDVLLLTLGTGIGSSLLLSGKIRHGAHNRGPEIGETLIYDAQRGNYRPVENLVSAGALMRRLGQGNGLLFDRARNGDHRAIGLIEEMYVALGTLIANVHLLLDIDKVIIGGGLAGIGNELIVGLQSAVDRICPSRLNAGLRVEAGNLPPDAASVIGATCLWYECKGILPRF